MNILGPFERKADDRSMEFIAYMVEQADKDPMVELALIGAAMKASRRHQKRLKERQIEIVQRQRDAGVPMKEIAEAAGVNDSYLARLAINAGGTRRSDRTRRRRRRNPQ